MAARLTDLTVRKLRPKNVQFEVMDSGNRGFGIRVSPGGTRTWIYRYRFGGTIRRVSLGTYSEIGLEEAKARYADAVKLHRQQIDPGALKQEKQRKELEAPTVGMLANEYLERWAKPRKRSWQEDKRILEKDVVPRWGGLKAKTIRKRDVIALLDGIVDRGAPIQANRTLACVRRMFNFAAEKDLIDASPCAGIKAPSAENQRDCVLGEKEIWLFWTNLNTAPMSLQIRLALRLQLVTAQRKGEVITMEWRDLDLESGVWTIPKEKAKNKIANRVPLSPIALGIIRDLKALANGSTWVFSSRGQSGHVRGDSINEALARSLDHIGVGNFVPHDLRRTASTYLSALGTPRLVLDKILNHVDRSTTSPYDQHTYDGEKRAALELWARRLVEIVEGTASGNVIKLVDGPSV
jgi:integrase